MGSVHAIGAAVGPANAGPGKGRLEIQEVTPAFQTADGVKLSSPAVEAAVASQVAELREERLEEVRDRLEEGAYKLQAALLKVAARVAPYVE